MGACASLTYQPVTEKQNMSVSGGWAKWSKKHFIHPETVEEDRIETENAQPASFYASMTLQNARDHFTLVNAIAPGVVPFDGLIKEIIVPVPHLKAGIPVTIYRPTDLPPVPLIVVEYHGGGLVVGDRAQFDAFTKKISMMLPAIVVNVEYRLLPCPEDPKSPFNDCTAVTQWILKNKTAVGGQNDSKVCVMGDSAGGQIASGVTYSIKEGIDFQVFMYPVADVKCDTESCKDFYDSPSFCTKMMETFIEITGIGSEEMVKDPRINPAARNDLDTCPPTLFIVGNLDPLRDWSKALAEKMKKAGVDVEIEVVDGVPHGFMFHFLTYVTTAQKGFDHIKTFLNSRM